MDFRRLVVRACLILVFAFLVGRVSSSSVLAQACETAGPTCHGTCAYLPGSDYWLQTSNCNGCYSCHFYPLWVYTATEFGCTNLCEVVYDGYCDFVCP